LHIKNKRYTFALEEFTQREGLTSHTHSELGRTKHPIHLWALAKEETTGQQVCDTSEAH